MKIITILLILLSNLFSYCQTNTRERIFPGSNLKVRLTENFKPSSRGSGFEDPNDSTRIFGFQMKLNSSIDDAIEEQEKSVNNLGFIVKKKEKVSHQGFEGATIEYEIPSSHFDGLILIFGKQNLQNIVSSVYNREKSDLLKKIILNVEMDEKIVISLYNLGFNALDQSGPYIKTDINSIAITYEHKNEIGVLMGNLKLTRLPNESFNNIDSKEYLARLSSKFFPNQIIISEDIYDLQNGKFNGYKRILKSIKTNDNPQYNYLVIIRFKKFDTVVVGSTNMLEDTKYMDEITNSIRLE